MLIVYDTNTQSINQLKPLAKFDIMRAGTRWVGMDGRGITELCRRGIGDGKRHTVTKLPASDKHAIAMRLGLEMYDKLELDLVSDRVLGFMRMKDRPGDAGLIDVENGVRRGRHNFRDISLFCIALAPEEKPKTARDLLQALIGGESVEKLRDEVRKFLDSEGDE